MLVACSDAEDTLAITLLHTYTKLNEKLQQ